MLRGPKYEGGRSQPSNDKTFRTIVHILRARLSVMPTTYQARATQVIHANVGPAVVVAPEPAKEPPLFTAF